VTAMPTNFDLPGHHSSGKVDLWFRKHPASDVMSKVTRELLLEISGPHESTSIFIIT
jgi:hypothetical protein